MQLNVDHEENVVFPHFLFFFHSQQQSMHWANPKTKDRMLPETGGSSLQAQNNPQMRRASEGGAQLYYG